MTARVRWTGAVLGYRWRLEHSPIARANDCKPMPGVTLWLARHWYVEAQKRYSCICFIGDGLDVISFRICAASWRGLDRKLRERLKQLAATAQKASAL